MEKKGNWMDTLGDLAEMVVATGEFFNQLGKQNQKKLNQDKALHDAFDKGVKESYEAGYKEGYQKGFTIRQLEAQAQAKAQYQSKIESYDVGYKKGYKQGYKIRQREAQNQAKAQDQSKIESYDVGYNEGYKQGYKIRQREAQNQAKAQAQNKIDNILYISLVFVLALVLMFVWKKFFANKNSGKETSNDQEATLSHKVYGELQDIKKELKTIKGPARIKRPPRETSSQLTKKRQSNIQNPKSQQTTIFKSD